MVFVLDNYDSFTYNLVQYIGELGAEPLVRRNNEVTIGEIESLNPDRILISPGPCTPQEAGISIDLIRHFAANAQSDPERAVPILGVCLGHQAIGAAFGGQVVRAKNLMHGKTSPVEHDGKTIFQGLPSPMTATRYHSLIVAEEGLPDELEISAWTADMPADKKAGRKKDVDEDEYKDNDEERSKDKNKDRNKDRDKANERGNDARRVIMGLRHKRFPIEGVQFHPESVLTAEGKKLVANFLNGSRL